MKNAERVLRIFPEQIKHALMASGLDMEELQELRLRAERPLMCVVRGRELFLSKNGKVCGKPEEYFLISRELLAETMSFVAHYSLYAFDEELRQGYLTIAGGHRVGVAGRIVMENGKIQSIKYISFLNVRFSHERKGCADPVLPYLVRDGAFCHTLIISPPRCGKTTLLRDIIRQASDGNRWMSGRNVGVVDERSEIGGSYQGIPQNDLGIRTDVLDCCPKSEGMLMLIRSMAPEIVAVDEIGDEKDSLAMEAVFHCGCKLLATVHGSSVEDIQKKPLLKKMIENHGFQRFIVLEGRKGVGHVRAIFDDGGNRIYGDL